MSEIAVAKYFISRIDHNNRMLANETYVSFTQLIPIGSPRTNAPLTIDMLCPLSPTEYDPKFYYEIMIRKVAK